MRFTATFINQNFEFHALTFLFNEPNGFAIYPALLFPICVALMLHKCDWKWVMAIIEHLDRVSHKHMPDVYKSASIVCLPSYREGLPSAPLACV